MTKRIVLCADDYGQAPAISEGIKELIQTGRLSATSCMVNSPHWTSHAAWLAPFKDQIDIGLHFNLTEGKALSQQYKKTYGDTFFSLSALMLKASLRQLDRSVLQAECYAQIERFIEATGFPPKFIDGHQHIHHFPVIRDALINVYRQHLCSYQPYVRLVKIKLNMLLTDYKKFIIYAMGTQKLQSLLIANQIPHNQSFSGIYSFSPAEKFETLFPAFLTEVEDNGLIMCHPGLLAHTNDDVIADARFKEYQYFSGDQFIEACQNQSVVLSKFSAN